MELRSTNTLLHQRWGQLIQDLCGDFATTEDCLAVISSYADAKGSEELIAAEVEYCIMAASLIRELCHSLSEARDGRMRVIPTWSFNPVRREIDLCEPYILPVRDGIPHEIRGLVQAQSLILHSMEDNA